MPIPQATAEAGRFPPAPWRLEGRLDLSVWLVPAGELAFEPPPGWRLLTLFGRGVVGGVWARYGPGGDLAYRELAVGVAVRRRGRIGVTLPWIWVDSARSQQGGRSLWAIPKRLASFRQFGGLTEATDRAGRLLASGGAPMAAVLPGRWAAALRIVQPAQGGAVVTRARLKGRPVLGRPTPWRAAGPLSFLDDQPPLLSLRLERASFRFGDLGRF